MPETSFFGDAPLLIAATTTLILFTLLGAFDGLYFHIWKYKLQRLPEARLEHGIHAARGLLFIPIAWIFFARNTGGPLLWLGLLILAFDLVLELIDILVEKDARRLIGGVTGAETALHVMATATRIAALTLILAAKPASAFSWSSPSLLTEAYPPFLAYTGALFALGTAAGTVAQLLSMLVAHLTRSARARGLSNEGLPIEQYDVLKVYLAMPLALALEALLKPLRSCIRSRVEGPMPPADAVLYSLHKDALLSLVLPESFVKALNLSFIGFHGIASYFPTYRYYRLGLNAIRYDRQSGERPKSTIIKALQDSTHGRVLIRTDSGRPYGRVRASLIDMAGASGRPLVPVVQVADRTVVIAEHTVPLPGCEIRTVFGEPIAAASLASMDREEARQLLQRRIDELAAAVVGGIESTDEARRDASANLGDSAGCWRKAR